MAWRCGVMDLARKLRRLTERKVHRGLPRSYGPATEKVNVGRSVEILASCQNCSGAPPGSWKKAKRALGRKWHRGWTWCDQWGAPVEERNTCHVFDLARRFR